MRGRVTQNAELFPCWGSNRCGWRSHTTLYPGSSYYGTTVIWFSSGSSKPGQPWEPNGATDAMEAKPQAAAGSDANGHAAGKRNSGGKARTVRTDNRVDENCAAIPPVTFEKETVEGVELQLHRCELSGSNLVCEFSIVSQTRDLMCYIESGSFQSGTFIVDDRGNNYRASRVQIGLDAGVNSAHSLVVAGNAVNAKARFESVGEDSEAIKTLALVHAVLAWNDGPAGRKNPGSHERRAFEFRKVPVAR